MSMRDYLVIVLIATGCVGLYLIVRAVSGRIRRSKFEYRYASQKERYRSDVVERRLTYRVAFVLFWVACGLTFLVRIVVQAMVL